MQKKCTSCGDIYFARWRNEPVTLCPECRIGVVVCKRCGDLLHPPGDPCQLLLFPLPIERGRSATWELEEYTSLRAKASQATRRKYPYH